VTTQPTADRGQIAYAAYARHTGGITYDGRNMRTWAELGDRSQGAWRAAADAVAAQPDDEAVKRLERKLDTIRAERDAALARTPAYSCGCPGDPIEYGHEAALGLAEAERDRLRLAWQSARRRAAWMRDERDRNIDGYEATSGWLTRLCDALGGFPQYTPYDEIVRYAQDLRARVDALEARMRDLRGHFGAETVDAVPARDLPCSSVAEVSEADYQAARAADAEREVERLEAQLAQAMVLPDGWSAQLESAYCGEHESGLNPLALLESWRGVATQPAEPPRPTPSEVEQAKRVRCPLCGHKLGDHPKVDGSLYCPTGCDACPAPAAQPEPQDQTKVRAAGGEWCQPCQALTTGSHYHCGRCGKVSGQVGHAACFRRGSDTAAAHPAPSSGAEPQDEARRWVHGAEDNPPWITPREAVETGVGLRNDRGRVWHYRDGGWALDGKRDAKKRWTGYDPSTRYGFWALVEQRGPLTEVPATSSGTGTEAHEPKEHTDVQ
jgi:DNA-directed RNA polymerase subunit RPC12/RpoP